jgi:hypothetical protein
MVWRDVFSADFYISTAHTSIVQYSIDPEQNQVVSHGSIRTFKFKYATELERFRKVCYDLRYVGRM